MKRKIMKCIAFVMALTFSTTTVYAGDTESGQNTEVNPDGTSIYVESMSEETKTQNMQIDKTDVEKAETIVVSSATEKTIEEIKEYALYFMKNSQPDHEIQINTIEPLYSLEDQITGYYVTFLRDGIPNGYVLLSFLHTGKPIVELSFDGLGICDEDIQEKVSSPSEKIRYLGPDMFYKDSKKEGVYESLTYGGSETKRDLERCYQITLQNLYDAAENIKPNASVASTIGGGIIDWEKTTLDPNTDYKIPKFGRGADYWITKDFSVSPENANCLPTALTNILWYWGFKYSANPNNSIAKKVASQSTLYDKATSLFRQVRTAVGTGGKTNGTPFDNVVGGLHFLFGTQGDIWNYKECPSFNSIYNTIIEGCPIIMYIGVTSPESEAHAIFALGRIAHPDGTKYIQVLDGWNRYGRLVINYYYPACRGFKIWFNANK